jgi:hypothetical protein
MKDLKHVYAYFHDCTSEAAIRFNSYLWMNISFFKSSDLIYIEMAGNGMDTRKKNILWAHKIYSI